MPKKWLYFIALLLPLAVWVLLLNTSFVDWLWYHQYTDYYYLLTNLRAQPLFMDMFGSWAFPVFVITVFSYWYTDDEDDNSIASQFLLLPVAYIPFVVIGTGFARGTFDDFFVYAYPMVSLVFGYLYVFGWLFCIWVFDQFRIVA